MKKYFLAGLLTCLAATTAQSQTITDRDREGLQGAVRSVTLETSTFINQNGQWQESKRRKLTTIFYNEKGMIKEVLQYRYDGELEAKQVVIYDEAGRRTETNFFNPDGSLNRRQLYTYDDKGRITKIQLVRGDGLFMNEDVRTFNEQGRLETGVMNDASLVLDPKQGWQLSPELRFNYVYDTQGRITEIQYLKGGVLDHKIIYRYNEQGIRTSSSNYDANEVLIEEDTWVADSKGKMLEHHHKAANTDLSSDATFTYKADERGNWIEQISTATKPDGSFASKNTLYRTLTYY